MSSTHLDLRLLIFDWDGTLMDSVASIVACMQRAAADLEMAPMDESLIRRTIGLGLEDTRHQLGLDDPEQWRQVVERYRHHWFSTFRRQPVLFAGTAAALERLQGRGYLLAVATGKSRRGLDRDLEKTGLGPRFAATRTADESFGKPHPQMVLDLLDELGARGEQALMVGDTTFDLEMAGAAGTHAVAVTSGSHSRDELLALKPLACLASVAELGGWLDDAARGPGGNR